MNGKFEHFDIIVAEEFIQLIAKKYIEQRSRTSFRYEDLDEKAFLDLGYDPTELKRIITQNTVAFDDKREQGLPRNIINDIYRSDLGELLMTYYFEEILQEGERFIIPFKNISFRERADMPGRGLDAIGYQLNGSCVNILLGEAKVSEEKQSPPAVVDLRDNSLYKTQKRYKENVSEVIQRLTDYCKRLNAYDATILGIAIVSMNNNRDNYSITYGCALIRDYECVDYNRDYGKLKSNSSEFEPGTVHFSILSFENKTIQETVDAFYQTVRKLNSFQNE